jgi:hypothetical protein
LPITPSKKLLVDAENWSRYFPAEDQVEILSGGRELSLGTRYSPVTVGFPMSLVVTECVPGRRLAWATTVDGDETGSSAYHGWVITPTADGCHVLTEETQQGSWFLEELGRKHAAAFSHARHSSNSVSLQIGRQRVFSSHKTKREAAAIPSVKGNRHL